MDVALAAACLRSRRALDTATMGAHAVFNGVWLGLLDGDALDELTARYYREQPTFLDATYNGGGLFDWERAAIEDHFPDGGRLLIGAAGAGREVLALAPAYEVEAFECAPELVARGNDELVRRRRAPVIRLSAPGRCPAFASRFDAAISGWGALSHISTRAARVAYLTGLRAPLVDGAPVLVSFLTRRADRTALRVSAAVGTPLRRLRRLPPVEVGDTLVPAFGHLFTSAEIRGELADAGFALVEHAEVPYGHAVARAA